LATARPQQLPDSAVEESAQKEELPHFMTLEGSISPLTLKAMTKDPMKLTHMSPVQAKVFPLLPKLAEPYDPNASEDGNPRDLLVKARTGTGKTLAFLLPAVEARLKAIEAHGKQAVVNAGLASDKQLELRAQRAFVQENLGTLIISPTRELATQIAVEAQKLTSHLDFMVNLFVGGASKGPQMRGWLRGRRDILVVTPGRLRDFLISEPSVASGLAKTQTVCFCHILSTQTDRPRSSFWTKLIPF
jgi:ATP-dependent RNA helicase MSS116, mitochondrial